jgi:hypothetical protein
MVVKEVMVGKTVGRRERSLFKARGKKDWLGRWGIEEQREKLIEKKRGILFQF